MDEQKLAQVIKGVVGTRTYIPISESEGVLVFERAGYIHIFKGITSIFGSVDATTVAQKIISLFEEKGINYHPDLLELVDGISTRNS